MGSGQAVAADLTEALRVLREVFGFDAFRPMQARVIDAVLRGRDCFVLMPTGGGKSLCYQIPALVTPGVAVVVSPLISLMKDQVDALRENGVAAAFCNSSQSERETAQVLADLRNGAIKLLYVSPERLMAGDLLTRLSQARVSLIAIDEAHCVSMWGHDFRPEYVQLGVIRDRLPGVPIVALTATADDHTKDDVIERLRLRDAEVFVAGFDRPNIRYTVVEKSHPQRQLQSFISERTAESGIIYCLSRKRVEQVAEWLRDAGLEAAAYHAGLPSSERARVQEAFQRDTVKVVVATVAFGMGIDKPNVRYVVHYDMPKNLEGYYQETGRAGRDGLPSEAFLMFSLADVVTARNLIEANENVAQREIELRKLSMMVDFAEALTCRRRCVLAYFGEDSPAECGNCDVCLDPPQQYDATDDAVAALMAVYELKQKFGMRHLIDVLRGSESARIRELGHHLVASYGKGKHHSDDAWASIFRQLVHRGYLRQDVTRYNSLKLTPATRPLLRDGARLHLAKPRVKVVTPARAKGTEAVPERDRELFERLRVLRRELAEAAQVPPYIIFGDATLRGIAAARPTSRDGLLKVSGVGQRKLESYGDRFLAEVKAYLAVDG